jgi:hypothetical protein
MDSNKEYLQICDGDSNSPLPYDYDYDTYGLDYGQLI